MNEWISTKDRLPEKSQGVLITVYESEWVSEDGKRYPESLKGKARAQNGTPQFKEYPIGSIEDWEEWDGEACVNLVAEVAREWANKYRNACFGYKKHKNLEHLQSVERQMKLTPMAILVNVGDVCEQIRHEFKIYDLDDEQISGKEQE